MKRISFLFCVLACFAFSGVARADGSAASTPTASVTFVQPDRDIDHSPPAVPEPIQPAPASDINHAPSASEPPRPILGMGPVHISEAQLERDARAAQKAQEELDEAQAALAASTSSTASSNDSSSTDAASTDDQSAPATETHHSMDELVESGSHLGPDASDSTHHSVESLSRPAGNAPSSTHHSMDELLSWGN